MRESRREMCCRGAFYLTLKSKLYKWFTRNNTYPYMDVLE